MVEQFLSRILDGPRPAGVYWWGPKGGTMKSCYWLIDTNDKNWWLWDAGKKITEEEAKSRFEEEEKEVVVDIQSANPPWDDRE